jgi:hypothetical protein
MTWRTGKKLGRTLYRDEVCVGIVDTPEIANEIVGALAEVERLRLIIEHDHVPMPGMPDVTVPRQMLEQGRVTLVAPDAEVARLRATLDGLSDATLEEWASLKGEIAAANALLVDIKREGVTLELRKRLVEHCGIGNEQPGVPVTTLRGGTTLRERVTFTTVQGQTLTTCTLADNESLRALDAVPTAVLQDWRDHTVHVRHIPACHELACIELARRAVKP